MKLLEKLLEYLDRYRILSYTQNLNFDFLFKVNNKSKTKNLSAINLKQKCEVFQQTNYDNDFPPLVLPDSNHFTESSHALMQKPQEKNSVRNTIP